MRVYRFGEFAFDTSSGELRREGYLVRLRPQPSAVLDYLLRHRGEVVTRDELRRLLWPEGTFVHFDHGLNSCIKQVRGALSDDRGAPRYLETIPRRGYRFIGVVGVEDANGKVSRADLALSCSVRIVGRRFHVIIQLADRSNNTQVWTADFDGELSAMSGTPSGIAAEILEAVTNRFPSHCSSQQNVPAPEFVN